jgi:hypothetical protein
VLEARAIDRLTDLVLIDLVLIGSDSFRGDTSDSSSVRSHGSWLTDRT